MSKTLKLALQYTGVLMDVVESPHPPPVKPPVLVMKQSLINCRQHEAFMKVLMRDILLCAENLDQLEHDFKCQMNNLRDTVQAKTAVPTSQVYPLFIALCQMWTGFQDEVVLLSVLSNLLSTMSVFTKNATKLVESPEFQALLGSATVVTDEERRAQSSGPDHRVKPEEHRKANFLFPESTKDFELLPLEFRGYCGYAFTVHDRLLLPANPNIGVLHHKGKYFAFSSKKAADNFATDPDEFLSIAVESSKKSPELIQLLDMHTHFSAGTPGARGGREKIVKAPMTKCNVGTQTDTHFMESNIIQSYEWNEWELRRKALKLANLRRKSTHSMQTNSSHYKRDIDTQIYLAKDDVTQTKSDFSISVPRPSTYITGLRGKDTSSRKVDLTLPVEHHNY